MNPQKLSDDISSALASSERFEEYIPPKASEAKQELIRINSLLQGTPSTKYMSHKEINCYLFNLHCLDRFLIHYQKQKSEEIGYLHNVEEIREDIEKKFPKWTKMKKEEAKKKVHLAGRAGSMFGESATWVKGLKYFTVRTLYRANEPTRVEITQWIVEAKIRNSFIDALPPSPSSQSDEPATPPLYHPPSSSPEPTPLTFSFIELYHDPNKNIFSQYLMDTAERQQEQQPNDIFFEEDTSAGWMDYNTSIFSDVTISENNELFIQRLAAAAVELFSSSNPQIDTVSKPIIGKDVMLPSLSIEDDSTYW